jgi:hypothetical protein
VHVPKHRPLNRGRQHLVKYCHRIPQARVCLHKPAASAHLVPQQAIVDEHTVQPITHNLVDKRGCNGGVHAARQRTNNVLRRAHLAKEQPNEQFVPAQSILIDAALKLKATQREEGAQYR